MLDGRHDSLETAADSRRSGRGAGGSRGAARPKALAAVSGGLWELSGIPNTKPLRECVADSMMLAQVEHRGEKVQPRR